MKVVHMLVVENLTKHFGDLKAVDNVTFTVEEGSILGMIGQNGSGKITSFSLIPELKLNRIINIRGLKTLLFSIFLISGLYYYLYR